MSRARPSGPALDAVPTLTEVLDLPPPARRPGDAGGDDDLVERLLARLWPDLRQAADTLLDPPRLRELVEPALERLADALVRDLRDELAAALREAARQAVEREVERQRLR